MIGQYKVLIKVGDKFKCQRIIQIQESMSRNRLNVFVENVALFSFELPNYFFTFIISLSWVLFISLPQRLTPILPQVDSATRTHHYMRVENMKCQTMHRTQPKVTKIHHHYIQIFLFQYFFFHIQLHLFNLSNALVSVYVWK